MYQQSIENDQRYDSMLELHLIALVLRINKKILQTVAQPINAV